MSAGELLMVLGITFGLPLFVVVLVSRWPLPPTEFQRRMWALRRDFMVLSSAIGAALLPTFVRATKAMTEFMESYERLLATANDPATPDLVDAIHRVSGNGKGVSE